MKKLALGFFITILSTILLPICSTAQNGVYFIPSTEQVDSVREILSSTSNDTLKMCAYYYLSSYYTELNKDSAEYFVQLQLDIAKKLHQKLWTADALFQLAYITYGLGDYPKSLTAINDGFAITDDAVSEKDNWRVTTFSGDGNAHRARLFIAASLHQIFAYLYQNVDNPSKAIAEFLTAIKIAESVDDKEELSLNNMSLGATYIDMNKLDSALMLENKALNYAIQSHYEIYTGTILEFAGNVYYIRKDYNTAEKYYNNAVNASIAQNNLKDEINAFLAVAKLKRVTGQLDSILYYARKALATSQIFNFPWGRQRAYNALFSAYKILKLNDSAFAYLQLAKALGDSVHDVESIKTNQYQSLNLSAQINQQEKEKTKIKADNTKRVYGLLTGIGLLLLIAFLLFRNSVQRKKANGLLIMQNHLIEHQKEKVESTLAELKATQKQLIQAEKMASLGELTAGIAHEIQNPLNFVNNFSEVSSELFDEMLHELNDGDKIEALAIADDIKQNLSKINHHGKRADAIVKSMLQHSQLGKGKKEPTDINDLVEKNMQLSYNSLRAKDKSFSAKINTHFDEHLPKADIIPQDMGRVFANLFNNAFYAVNQRQKIAGAGYIPEVWVSSSVEKGHVVITVKDNGIGMPEHVKEKIMQPFFTTKPTGEGVGLGLSLTYDIVVHGHGGSIEVNSIEGEGAEFIVRV